MRVLLFVPLAFAVCACSGPQPPVVDMTGVDPGKHSRDLAACDAERYEGKFEMGNPLSNCMERKGYRVLVRH